MKPKQALILCIAILSLISGYLISRASLIGGVGMSLFYKQYTFLKTWWKGAIVVFLILMILFFVQGLLQKRIANPRRIQILLLVFAGLGLYFTYSEFRHDLSYRLMGERFHLGFYLFWINWMLISLFYIFTKPLFLNAGSGQPDPQPREIQKANSL